MVRYVTEDLRRYELGSAKPAIEQDIEHGWMRYAKEHSKTKPCDDLPTWREVLSVRANWPEGYDRITYEAIKAGKQPRTKSDRGAAERLIRLGLVQTSKADGRYLDSLRPDVDESAEYIWLPNTLVTGTDHGEESPVRRLRSAGDIWTLRLVVDLYHSQNLRDDGGISPQFIRQNYERKLVGERGIFNVWAFKQRDRELYGVGHLPPTSLVPRWKATTIQCGNP